MNKVLFFFFALLSIPGMVHAQQYTVGTGTGGNAIPLGAPPSWANYKCQFLYLANEIGSAPSGTITKVYWIPTTTGTTTYSNFTIKITQNSITSLVAAYQTGLTTVYYSASQTIAHTNGTAMGFQLQTPFTYDKNQSLIVEISATATTGTGMSLRTSSAVGNRRGYGLTSSTTGSVSATLYNFGCDIQTCPNPVFTLQPADVNMCSNTNTAFKLRANNASFYQWQMNDGTGYVNISNNSTFAGATTDSLTVTNMPFAYDGHNIRCRVTGACSNPTFSDTAEISLIPGISIAAQSDDDTVCSGAPTELNVQTNGAVTGYKWQMAVPTVGIYYDVPAAYPFTGTNSSSLKISPVQDTLNGYVFRLVAGSQCNDAVSAAIKMNTLIPPVITEHPQHDTIVIGNFAQFDAGVTGKEYVHYWQASADGSNFVNINNNSIYTGANTGMLLVSNMPLGFNGYQFRCIIKSVNPFCGEYRDTSDAATLVILNPAGINDAVTNSISATLYPNPASGSEIFIQTTAALNNAGVKLYDLTGKLVRSQPLSFSNGIATVLIDNLPAGMYLLQMLDDNGTLLYKSKFNKL